MVRRRGHSAQPVIRSVKMPSEGTVNTGAQAASSACHAAALTCCCLLVLVGRAIRVASCGHAFCRSST
ncbi:MAG: hypothetical protein ACRD0K_23630, partial [Egibacteraceae bacterium]